MRFTASNALVTIEQHCDSELDWAALAEGKRPNGEITKRNTTAVVALCLAFITLKSFQKHRLKDPLRGTFPLGDPNHADLLVGQLGGVRVARLQNLEPILLVGILIDLPVDVDVRYKAVEETREDRGKAVGICITLLTALAVALTLICLRMRNL
jgi:hypothetical protein